jgi:ATP-dependent exoDNAse (exonuclease V) alpha subunit
LSLPHGYLEAGYVQHAYAVTTHLAQGATVDAALVLVHEDATSLNQGYTAASRARHETRQIVIPSELQAGADEHENLATLAERLAVREDPRLALRTLPERVRPAPGRER